MFDLAIPATQVNYSQLQALLAAGRWEEADLETRSLMLQVVGLPESSFLMESLLCEFPHEPIGAIDRLWRKFSRDRFGFSIQNRIWHEIGGRKPGANYHTWLEFGRSVGWLNGHWLVNEQLTFDLTAPAGHLPAFWAEELELGDIAVSLFDRLEMGNG
jgi:eukaryotic-like serine/threonine-protein kinase